MKLTNKQKREMVRNDYNAIANEYVKTYSKIDYCKKYVDDFAKTLKGKKILDVGCGAGQFTNYLCKLGFNAKGIDFSASLIDIAKQKYPEVDFVCADIVNYKTTELFDGIFVKDMLFHLSDQDIIKTLDLFKKILNPTGGGICIIMELSKKSNEHIFVEELDERYKIYYNYLTPDKLKFLLEQSGFCVNKLEKIVENENAGRYASGLMIALCSTQQEI